MPDLSDPFAVHTRKGSEVADRLGFTLSADCGNSETKKDRNASLMRLDRIKAATQVRTEFDDEAIRGLAESISQNDLQQPIKVRWSAEDAMYVIVSAERWYRAMQLVENLHRGDSNPKESARRFQVWMNDNSASAATTSRQWASDSPPSDREASTCWPLLELVEQTAATVRAEVVG